MYFDLIEKIKNMYGDNFFVTTNFDFDPNQINQSNILVLTKDHWGDDEFMLTPEHLRPMFITNVVKELVNKFPKKKFYIATCCPYLFEFFSPADNAKIIHWGDDFLLSAVNNYQGLDPLFEKTFDQPWHWICLNNNRRMHRSVCALFLLGGKIPNGFLKFDPSLLLEHDSWASFKYYLEMNNYEYVQMISKIDTILEKGFDRVKSLDGFHVGEHVSVDEFSIYRGSRQNFDRFLKEFFAHSCVDIINETVFISRTGIVTEKYINSIYGCNFPIILSMAESVNHLRSLGFDLFDDIIDHNYDLVQDHYVRMQTAILSNKKILENRELAIESWHRCRDRFKHNVNVVESMYRNKETLALSRISQGIESYW